MVYETNKEIHAIKTTKSGIEMIFNTQVNQITPSVLEIVIWTYNSIHHYDLFMSKGLVTVLGVICPYSNM